MKWLDDWQCLYFFIIKLILLAHVDISSLIAPIDKCAIHLRDSDLLVAEIYCRKMSISYILIIQA